MPRLSFSSMDSVEEERDILGDSQPGRGQLVSTPPAAVDERDRRSTEDRLYIFGLDEERGI